MSSAQTAHPSTSLAGLRIILTLCAFACAATARADDPIDSLMYRVPTFPTPRVVLTFSDKLPALWLEALARPEAEPRCQAAATIAQARDRGMSGLEVAIPALTRELGRADQHPTVRLAAARALVALDAKDAASAMMKLVSLGDSDLREVIEPALARWAYAPAKVEWSARLAKPPADRRGAVLAIQGLVAFRDAKAVLRLRELVLSAETPAVVRLEAARGLGVIRKEGGEADADLLSADATPKGRLARIAAAWTLRHHAGAEAIRRMQAMARDVEPSVAAVAVARLVELDPKHVEPALKEVLGSSDANVRSLGVEVLFRRPSDNHFRLLGDALSDPHPDVRSQARRALRDRGKEAAWLAMVLKEGERVLGANDWRGKEQASVLLAHLNHKPAADRLVELLADNRPEVAIAAAWALRVLAVPATYPKALDHFKRATGKATPPAWVDYQLTHIAQMFGEARYAQADRALRAIVPPKSPPGHETRAAACWALGLIYEGKNDEELAAVFAGRLAAQSPFDIEDPRVRRMSAVALGRMKAKEQLETLRKFAPEPKPSLEPVNNSCMWAIEQITGEKVLPAGILEAPQIGWFLTPVGP